MAQRTIMHIDLDAFFVSVEQVMEPGKQLSMLNDTEQRLESLNRAVDRIRVKYGFSAIQTGRTMWLKEVFPDDNENQIP